MAAPVYATDLSLIDDAQASSSFSATGGGASGLNDETDYFINGTQCVSKNGFTADEKGMLHDDVSAPSITAGDAVFIWLRQANRNLLLARSSGGGQVIMGTSSNAFAQFYVDGNDEDGSPLLSWVSYAVDPTQTASNTTGSPGAASGWDHFGGQWNLGGSGSLKGAPNAVGKIWHGRELNCTQGDVTNGYATFDGAATFDANVSRAWGILTPITGGYAFHGLFSFGTSAASVDFRDANRSIVIRNDYFVPAGFNAFDVRNASSNVDLTNINVQALGTTSRGDWITTNNATVALNGCTFQDMRDFDFDTNTTVDGCNFLRCNQVTQAGATIEGGTTIDAATATVAFVMDDDTAATDMEFTNNTTAIDATSAIVANEVNLTDMRFSGNTTDITVASASNITVNNLGTSNATTCTNTGAGNCTVVSSVSVQITILDEDGDPISGAQVSVYLNSDNSEVLNTTTNASGIASGSFSGTTPAGAYVRFRKSSTGSTRYISGSASASIASGSGLVTQYTMRTDPIVAP